MTQYKKVSPRVRASSQYSLLYAPVAQMVEHEIFNFVVRGSSPFWRTISDKCDCAFLGVVRERRIINLNKEIAL